MRPIRIVRLLRLCIYMEPYTRQAPLYIYKRKHLHRKRVVRRSIRGSKIFVPSTCKCAIMSPHIRDQRNEKREKLLQYLHLYQINYSHVVILITPTFNDTFLIKGRRKLFPFKWNYISRGSGEFVEPSSRGRKRVKLARFVTSSVVAGMKWQSVVVVVVVLEPHCKTNYTFACYIHVLAFAFAYTRQASKKAN